MLNYSNISNIIVIITGTVPTLDGEYYPQGTGMT